MVKKIKHPSEVVMIRAAVLLFQDGHFSIDIKARNGVYPETVESLQTALTRALSEKPPKKEARPIAVTQTNLAEPKKPVGALRKATP